MKKITISFILTVLVISTITVTHGALSARPWNAGGWSALPVSTQISQIASWISSNISQRSDLTVEPWNEPGYSGLTTAQKYSKQMDWQFLKRRATDTEDVIAVANYEKVVNSSTTKEYFVPDKTSTEWNNVRASIVAGQVPDLSLQYCGRASLSLSDDTACAIKPSGQIYCWGRDDEGQLGNGGGATAVTSPTLTSGGSSWKTLADGEGDQHHCAINNSNDLYCWGGGAYGRLGDGSTGNNTTPGIVSGGHKWKMASTGDYNTCGITTAGTIYCWGKGATEVNGDGSSTANRTTPNAISGGGNWTHIAVGREHACALNASGTAYCWGKSVDYPGTPLIGDGSTSGRTTATTVSGGYTFVDLKVGEHHSCGLEADGDLFCWGDGAYGRLGDNATSDNLVPGIVSGGHKWKKDGFTPGEWQTCAIRESDDKLYCWGYGSNRAIGDGTLNTRTTPRASAEAGPWAIIAMSYKYGCGIKTNGQAYCWGRNEYGELGNGGGYGSHELTPNAVIGGHTFTSEYCDL